MICACIVLIFCIVLLLCNLGSCRDTYNTTQCAIWAQAYECIKNPSWMLVNCQFSCKSCPTTTEETPTTTEERTEPPTTTKPPITGSLSLCALLS